MIFLDRISILILYKAFFSKIFRQWNWRALVLFLGLSVAGCGNLIVIKPNIVKEVQNALLSSDPRATLENFTVKEDGDMYGYEEKWPEVSLPSYMASCGCQEAAKHELHSEDLDGFVGGIVGLSFGIPILYAVSSLLVMGPKNTFFDFQNPALLAGIVIDLTVFSTGIMWLNGPGKTLHEKNLKEFNECVRRLH